MVEPKKAPIRPRVCGREIPANSLLEDLIETLLAGRHGEVVALVGESASGRTTALKHLADRFEGEPRLALFDYDDPFDGRALSQLRENHVVVIVSDLPPTATPCMVCSPAPWTNDEAIEYLASRHPDRCASVMSRLAASDCSWLKGDPTLIGAVLDALAADESILDARGALRRAIADELATPAALSLARMDCFAQLASAGQVGVRTRSRRADLMLRCREAQVLLAADHVLAKLTGAPQLLEKEFPSDLLDELGPLLRGAPVIQEILEQEAKALRGKRHAMAASLLHAAGVPWQPGSFPAPNLAKAYLPGISWPRLSLEGLRLPGALLAGADLSEARLPRAVVDWADLTDANLRGANLFMLSARQCNLAGADLSFVRATKAELALADLTSANLEGALLEHANLTQANLTGARCARAKLARANLRNAKVAEADFSGADLTHADLQRICLSTANFAGANFSHADLTECDLEGMTLPGALFDHCNFTRAHLTGTVMPRADLRGARFREAGLAEIDWEGADLRGADLRGCTFHMGSTRSGLVDSPIACEGSKTGFYTDEYVEQTFREPEEIRKANLRFVDLRGARIDDVDFYLVDLRGARYTFDQEQWLRRSGAILSAPVS